MGIDAGLRPLSSVSHKPWSVTSDLQTTTYRADEPRLAKLDQLQGDRQADRNQVIIQDNERQEVIEKRIGRQICKWRA